MADNGKAELLIALNEDRALAASVLFPHRHKQNTPLFHIDIMDLWQSAFEMVWIEAFRQGAKTTLSEESLLMEALFGNFRYCLIFGETYTKACQRIAAMKHELNTNRHLHSLFGNHKLKVSSENKIVLHNDICIEAHGWEEEIRGYLHLGNRPDRSYLDDIETRERVRDKETVDKNWAKLYKELIPAMDKDNMRIRMTGTPLAEDCMITRAKASSHWIGRSFPILNVDGTSAWPERYPVEWIEATRAKFEEQGLLREYNQEYMLIPAGAAGKPFTEDMVAFEDVAPLGFAPKVMIVDPARTTDHKKSDQTGYVVVSRMGSRIYVHESGAKYWQPDEIITGMFETSEKFGEAEVAVEKNSLDNWLLQPIRNHMLRVGKFLKLKVFNAPQDRDKTQFIMGLRPFFVAHDIVLVGGRSKHQTLLAQILNFPSGKKDCLNALAYIQRVFSGVPVYGEFGDRNIVIEPVVSRNAVLLLGANATGSETTCVLAALDGVHLTVLRDWVSPDMPVDAIPKVSMMLRAEFPGRKVVVWVPSDIYDQAGRSPLLSALKTAGLTASRGAAASMCRGSLGSLLRTEVQNKRRLRVASTATDTLQALASGYNFQVKPDGTRAPEPERNSARTLLEALEVLTSAIERAETSISFQPNAYNVNGKPYISALGR